MGENAELQEEELEVIKSIYEGDELYSSPKNTRHLYKFGEDAASRSFILGERKNFQFEVEMNLSVFLFRDKLGTKLPRRITRYQLRLLLQQTCVAVCQRRNFKGCER